MITTTSIPLLNTLIPANLQKDSEASERTQTVCMRLALRILQNAEIDFAKERYPSFDGNPGDSQCQVRAICLLHLVEYEKEQLLTELRSLREKSGLPENGDKSGAKMTGLSALVRDLVSQKDPRPNLVAAARNQFASIQVSPSLCFLLQAYLSEIFRQAETIDPNTGRICTRGEADRLDRIENGLGKDRLSRVSILQYNQTELSKISAEFLKEMMKRYGVEESLFAKDITTCLKAPSRTFTSLFHTTKAALTILCKMQGVVCIQEIVPKTKELIDPKRGWKRVPERAPRELYFQAPPSPEQIWLPITAPKKPVMVIQVVMTKSTEKVLSRFENESLFTYIISQAAHCPPFEPRSTVENVPDKEARNEIRAYQKLFPPPFDLDLHHYFIEMPNRGENNV